MPLKSPNPPKLLRLNKFLSQGAGCSRRSAEDLIKKGQVFVNNKKISHPACLIDTQKDKVRIRKKSVSLKTKTFVYLMLNKPGKVLSTSFDPKGRPLVMDYIKKHRERLFAVGRLDWDSEGLLLLTNDGDFSNKVLHPKSKIPKTYLVKVRGCPKDSQIKKLVQGLSTPLGRKKALFAKKISQRQNIKSSWIKVMISEGKKRQIRLMFEKLAYPVQILRRTAIGRLKMNKLAKGSFVRLTQKEVEKVFQWPKELKK